MIEFLVFTDKLLYKFTYKLLSLTHMSTANIYFQIFVIFLFLCIYTDICQKFSLTF